MLRINLFRHAEAAEAGLLALPHTIEQKVAGIQINFRPGPEPLRIGGNLFILHFSARLLSHVMNNSDNPFPHFCCPSAAARPCLASDGDRTPRRNWNLLKTNSKLLASQNSVKFIIKSPGRHPRLRAISRQTSKNSQRGTRLHKIWLSFTRS